MNRRNTLKALAAASVGTVALGYWAKDLNFIRDLMSNSFFKPSEQDLITSIADTIIPRGAYYGAVDLGVPVYLLGFFEKCQEKADQDQLKLQLATLNLASNKKFNADFVDCTPEQREQLLTEWSESKVEAEQDFFNLMKSQTITGFRTTEEVMTNHYHYRVVPGHYRGCVDINQPFVS